MHGRTGVCSRRSTDSAFPYFLFPDLGGGGGGGLLIPSGKRTFDDPMSGDNVSLR